MEGEDLAETGLPSNPPLLITVEMESVQVGSHVKLRRMGPHGEKQTSTVLRHKELDTGTLLGIFRQTSRYVPDQELRPHFFTE